MTGRRWAPVCGFLVWALATDGTTLYAAGNFPGGVARWDGTAWSVVGGGVDGAGRALALREGVLYLGGAFSTAGGQPAKNIAAWDGTAWSALGSGMDGEVGAIALTTDAVYAAISYQSSVTFESQYVAQWDGGMWSNLGKGVKWPGNVYALAQNGANLFVGGEFNVAGGEIYRRASRG